MAKQQQQQQQKQIQQKQETKNLDKGQRQFLLKFVSRTNCFC